MKCKDFQFNYLIYFLYKQPGPLYQRQIANQNWGTKHETNENQLQQYETGSSTVAKKKNPILEDNEKARSSCLGLRLRDIVIKKPLPEPMLLPYSFIHFVNWNSLCFGQQKDGEQAHYNNPRPEEEEDPGSHTA